MSLRFSRVTLYSAGKATSFLVGGIPKSRTKLEGWTVYDNFVSDSLNDLEEKLSEQLAGENKELFLRFYNAYAEFMGECELDTFITGFRLGARLMMDTFLSDEAPFESFLEG